LKGKGVREFILTVDGLHDFHEKEFPEINQENDDPQCGSDICLIIEWFS
jgi:hypothetical protein